MTKKIFLIFSLFILAVSACKTSDQVKGNSIIGTWKQVGISKTTDGERQPLTEADVSWVFNADGTGTYTQIVKNDKKSPANGTSQFKWRQEGEDIIMTSGKTGRELKYTIVKRNGSEMVWKTYVTGDFYIVAKQ